MKRLFSALAIAGALCTAAFAQSLPAPQVQTQSSADNSSKAASTAFVKSLINSSFATVDSLAAIRSLPVTSFAAPPSVITRGYATAGDGGGATYDWNSTSTSTDDGIFIVKVTAVTTGRYILRENGEVNPRQAGAKCDATFNGTGTDDAAQLNYLAAVMQTRGGGTIKLGKFICRVTSADLFIGRRVALVGVSSPRVTSGSDPSAFYSGIALNPARTITASGSSRISQVLVMRDGLGQKPADMPALVAAVKQWFSESSVGITATADKPVVEDTMIVGFRKCLYVLNSPAPVIRNVDFDCADGIHLQGVHDTPSIISTNANNFWGFNLTNRLGAWSVGSVAAGGSGYTNGDALTISGGTCTIQPTMTAAVTAGAVTGATVVSSGDCTVFPSDPVSVTGGSGAGATFDMVSNDASYRPGIGYFFLLGEGGNTFSTAAIGYQTGMVIRNWYGLSVTAFTAEGGHNSQSHGMVGLSTQDCAANIKITAPYIDTFNVGMQFTHKAAADGGSCSGAANQNAYVTVVGGHVGQAITATTYTNELVRGSNFSKGAIIGTQFGGGAHPRIIISPSANWIFNSLLGTNALDIDRSIQVNAAATVDFQTEIFGTPSSASDTCSKGQRRYDASYRYTCIATNTWVRTGAGSTW